METTPSESPADAGHPTPTPRPDPGPGLALCVLASGSSGNCVYVGSATTGLLVDAGLSGRETLRRLALLGLDMTGVRGICLTHEHDDHRAALAALQNQHGTPLYANSGFLDALRDDAKLTALRWNVFTTGSPFTVGDLTIEPFSVPHDSMDPVGFVIARGPARVGVVTDMGMATHLIRERLRTCQAIVVEANHDQELLLNCRRPWSLKQRILGRQGHLSNAQAAELTCEVAGNGLRHVFLAHLSRECNTPALAARAVGDALARAGHSAVTVHLTWPDQPSAVVTVG